MPKSEKILANIIDYIYGKWSITSFLIEIRLRGNLTQAIAAREAKRDENGPMRTGIRSQSLSGPKLGDERGSAEIRNYPSVDKGKAWAGGRGAWEGTTVAGGTDMTDSPAAMIARGVCVRELCVCVCVCVRARARACVCMHLCACVCVCLPFFLCSHCPLTLEDRSLSPIPLTMFSLCTAIAARTSNYHR